jgi:hypothetical protein
MSVGRGLPGRRSIESVCGRPFPQIVEYSAGFASWGWQGLFVVNLSAVLIFNGPAFPLPDIDHETHRRSAPDHCQRTA